MTPEQFCYWLQGYCELNPLQERPTERQWASIKDHLQLTFKKVTAPVYGPGIAPAVVPHPNPFAPPQRLEITC